MCPSPEDPGEAVLWTWFGPAESFVTCLDLSDLLLATFLRNKKQWHKDQPWNCRKSCYLISSLFFQVLWNSDLWPPPSGTTVSSLFLFPVSFWAINHVTMTITFWTLTLCSHLTHLIPQTTLQPCTILTPSFQMRKLRHSEACDLSKVTPWMFGRAGFQTQAIWLWKSCSLLLCHQPLVVSHVLLVTNSGPLSRISGPLRHESLDSPSWGPVV